MQSPLGKFFGGAATPTSVNGEGAGMGAVATATVSPPRTPMQKGAGSVGRAAAGSAAMMTPASADGTRKRGAASAAIGAPGLVAATDPETKKQRAFAPEGASDEISSAVGNNIMASQAGICLPLASQVTEGDAPPVLQDLRAAQEEARRANSKLPPYLAECFHHYASGGGAQYSWPEWLKPEKLRDAQGRRPGEPNYCPDTLQVPSEKVQKDSGHGTPMLFQYWKLKTKHFDKIALFKVGKFYEIFYYDAFIAQRECNLKWMSSDKRPHVGFPEMAKHDYAKKLVSAGFKVVVVEQVERVAEKQAKVASSQNTCVEREACEVFTKGTLVEPGLLGSGTASYMVYLHFEEAVGGVRPTALPFAACLVDAATAQIYIGRVVDTPDRNALRTLMAQVQPSEVVYSTANLPNEVLGLVRRLPCRPQLSSFRSGCIMAARDRLAKYRASQRDKLSESVEAALQYESTMLAGAGVLDYLDSVLLGQRVAPFATWDVLDAVCSSSQVSGTAKSGKRMVLDATALSALEVLETLEGTYKGSLLEFLDHTTMPIGFRLFKQWLCAPLYEAAEIRERQDVVAFFMQRTDLMQQLRTGLKKVPVDLERATSRVWGFALQAERHAVMYEDITAKRLGDFMSLLRAYEQCLQLLRATLSEDIQLPQRLILITRTKNGGGCLPELQPVISHLSGSVISVTHPKTGKAKFCPVKGADSQYDNFCQRIDAIIASLEAELQGIRGMFTQKQLCFVHRAPGFRYEIECDDGALPEAFMTQVDVTSKQRAGKVRFQTPRIKQLLAELENLEDQREDCIFPFLAKLFQEFHAHQASFRAAVRCLAELDALLSLAVASQGLSGSSCRAEVVQLDDPEAAGTLELRSCSHPVAASKMGNSFVPNDTLLNAASVPATLVVTGPNMGGKSTVLRQTCVAVMMAQLGCRVNARLCRLSPFDRIFTRIGSYDAILEGKSTLLTELEETAAILAHGGPRSLAVLDELGRGTSTFDGAAIAAAVLDDLGRRVRCRLLLRPTIIQCPARRLSSRVLQPFILLLK